MATSVEGSTVLPYRESFLRSLVWHDARMDILFDVLAHPDNLPSIPELVYMNQMRDPGDVLFHASMLVEYDILERVTTDADEGEGEAPAAFYGLTEDGWAVMDHFDQFDAQTRERLRQVYDFPAKPDHIAAAEAAPRPEPPATGDGG